MIESLEQEFNGKIRWKSFSIWYADSDSNLRPYGVFLFLIDNVFRFRDYKHVKTVLGFEIKEKNPEEYVPFNGSFNLEDIKFVTKLTKRRLRHHLLLQGFLWTLCSLWTQEINNIFSSFRIRSSGNL
ncbi:MAG: hypothetical protein ACSW73_02825 [Spirochaetales bacterium]